MKYTEITGKTVEEAIAAGLEELGLTAEQAQVEVIDEPGKSFLGIFGARPARVVVRERIAGVDDGKPIFTMPTPATEKAVEGSDDAQARLQAFLENISAMLGAPATVELAPDEENEGALRATLSGEGMGKLIGHRGETLDALQYLAGQVYNKESGQGGYRRVVLDSENYRRKRMDVLVTLGARLAEKAIRTGRRVELEPMNPYERRILHASLQNNSHVSTHSEGEEPNRFVVITPK